MKNLQAVFFDLDHTLWDFDKNSRETLEELYAAFNLEDKGVRSMERFIDDYIRINHQMWDEYHHNKISKTELRFGRFRKVLQLHDLFDQSITKQLSLAYTESCPGKKNVFPGAIETLNYLKNKYTLHIITNGFKEAQHRKLASGNLTQFFDNVHISEEIGCQKPDPGIFHHAVKNANATHSSCVMIGDNLFTDIAGADSAGIRSILFDPEKKHDNKNGITVINRLQELTTIL
jgi:putative hydrolase of the HAD superfamily